ncbi:MAG: hypothetical protein IPF72_16130 [Chitinophagaceae bacterium]|nr:hypothetical protein [Chitinophagaceae bacterium]
MQLKIKDWPLLFFLLLYTISCNQQHNENQPGQTTLKAAEPKGNLVPGDSIAISQSIPVEKSKLKKVLAGKPFTTNINRGFHISGNASGY